MRLRRLELVIIAVTLAFACFIGGYFTGRSVSAVSISPTVSSQSDSLPSAGPETRYPAGGGQDSAAASPETPESALTPDAAVAKAPETVGAPRAGDGRININSASRSELMDLPGIGSTLSERIVEYRNKYGPFLKIEDIKNVTGIGDKRFEAIREKITVG